MIGFVFKIVSPLIISSSGATDSNPMEKYFRNPLTAVRGSSQKFARSISLKA